MGISASMFIRLGNMCIYWDKILILNALVVTPGKSAVKSDPWKVAISDVLSSLLVG